MTGIDAMDVLDGLVLEVDDDGNDVTWGALAYDWQSEDAAAVLDETSAVRHHYLTRPRGGRKTTDLAGVAISWLLAQSTASGRCFVVASDEEQGQELLEAAADFVRNTPGLGSIDVLAKRIVNNSNRAAVVVMAADGAGSFGKRKPDLTIIDELAQWPSTRSARRVWTGVTSAVPKGRTGGRNGGRLVILTTAGDPAHWSYKVLEAARTDPAWRVHELPGPLPWRTPEDLRTQRSLIPFESEYSQLHLNQWTAGEDRLVTVEQLAACVTLDSDRWPLDPHGGVGYVIALDLSRTNDNTVASVCHAERLDGGDTRIVLDAQKVWTPNRKQEINQGEVEQWIASASELYLGAQVVMDAYDASGMSQRLNARGVSSRMVAFTAQNVGRFANRLHWLLRRGLLALPDDEALIDELAHVRLRQTSPGVYRMDHDSGRHDDRALSLALAVDVLLESPLTTWALVDYDSPDYLATLTVEQWSRRVAAATRQARWDMALDGPARTSETELLAMEL